MKNIKFFGLRSHIIYSNRKKYAAIALQGVNTVIIIPQDDNMVDDIAEMLNQIEDAKCDPHIIIVGLRDPQKIVLLQNVYCDMQFTFVDA